MSVVQVIINKGPPDDDGHFNANMNFGVPEEITNIHVFQRSNINFEKKKRSKSLQF